MAKPKYIIRQFSNKELEECTDVADECRKKILKTKEIEKMAFILRLLMETFEETQNCTVPFKGRYTAPVYNYQDKGTELLGE